MEADQVMRMMMFYMCMFLQNYDSFICILICSTCWYGFCFCF